MTASSPPVTLLILGEDDGNIWLLALPPPPLVAALMKKPAVGSSKWTSRQEASPEIWSEDLVVMAGIQTTEITSIAICCPSKRASLEQFGH